MSRPPPAPTKTRRVVPPRPAKSTSSSPDHVNTIAEDLAQLTVGPGDRGASLKTRTVIRTTRAPPVVKPLGRSTAANRQLPSTNPSSAESGPKPRRPLVESKIAAAEEIRAPAERARDAMKAVNASLAALAALKGSGFRAGSSSLATSSATPSSSRSVAGVRSSSSSAASYSSGAVQGGARDKAEQAARDATHALRELRGLASEGVLGRKRIDVEKAAGGVIANLVELGMYRHALIELVAMRAALLSWWSWPAPARATATPFSAEPLLSHLKSLSVPLPPASFFAPSSLSDTLNSTRSCPTFAEVVPLVMAMQQYLLACLFRSAEVVATEIAPQLAATLSGVGGPLDWHAAWEREGPKQDMAPREREGIARRLDAMMTGIFATVTKGCSGLDGRVPPEHLLSIRIYALLCYASTTALTSADKISAFFDQLRKILLLYGRAAEGLRVSASRIGAQVKHSFERVVSELDRKGLLSQTGPGDQKWRELCEVVLHIARRADDLAFISRAENLLGVSDGPLCSATTPVSPIAQSSHLCAKIADVLSIFEDPQRTPSRPAHEAADALRRALGALPLLRPLRLLPRSALELAERSKIDKLIERTHYALARYAKRGVTRLDLLMTPADAPAAPAPGEVDELVHTILDALAAYAEALALHSSTDEESDVVGPREREHYALGAVDSLLILAYSSIDLSSPSPPARALTLLRRARALVDLAQAPERVCLTVGPQLDRGYSLRTLASASYNIGGTLYNSGRAADALGFVAQSCELSERVLAKAKTEGLLGDGDGSDILEGFAELELGEKQGPEGIEGAEQQEREKKRRADRKEMVKDFERLIGRRLELLAFVQHQLGDKKAAYDAYITSALSQPMTVFHTLASDSATIASVSLLAAHAPLYQVIQRLTRLAVFDLLVPASSIPLVTAAPSRTAPLPHSAVGALLEMQLAALEPYSDKDEARDAIDALLAALDQVYEADELPMRRARVLVRRMQACVHGGRVERRGVVERLAAEVRTLCERETHSADIALRPFAPQYLALSHLFLAVHAHASEAPSPALNASVASHARSAISVLRTAVDIALPLSPTATQTKRSSPVVTRTHALAPVASPPAQDTSAVARTRRTTRSGTTPARPTRALTASTRRAGRSAAVPPPPAPRPAQVTPPRKTKGQVNLRESTRTPAKPSDASEILLDDVDRVFSALDSTASLLGTLGEILLKVAYLKFLRRLSAKLPQRGNDAYIASSVRLARTYLQLGKTSRAGIVLAQAEGRMPSGGSEVYSASPLSQISYWLCYAEYLALLGSHDRSAHAYESALSIAEILDEEASAISTTAKIVERTILLQRTSQAASVCSVILQRKGELSRAVAPAMQAMRLATRALNNMMRLTSRPSSTKVSNSDSTFSAPTPDHRTALADAPPVKTPKSETVLPGGVHAGLSLQLSEDLLAAILRVAALHFVRGTPKSADFFAQQAIDLAEDLVAPRQMVRALALQTDVSLHRNQLDEAAVKLERIEKILGSTTCPETAELHRLQASLHKRAQLQQDAYQFCLAAQTALDAFISAARDGDAGSSPVKQHTPIHLLSPAHRRISGPSVHFAALAPSPVAQSGLSPTADWVMPSMQAELLRMQIIFLRMQKKFDEARQLSRRLARLASLEEDKADELHLLATSQLQDLLARCSSDPVLGMLPDSVLSMPVLGISAAGPNAVAKIGTPRTGPTAIRAIKEIEALLERAITFSSSRSHPAKLRELSTLSTSLRAMQASVGKLAKRSSTTVAHVLDLGAAVTLRREMLNAVEFKLAANTRHDDLTWPAIEQPVPKAIDKKEAALHSLRERYRFENAEPTLVDPPLSSLLPPAWSALTLHLTTEHDSLIICRHRHDTEPLVFKLPLDRLARREGEEDEAFTFQVAVGELRDIITASNAGTQSAKTVDGREARAAWWAERRELDQRLQTLLENIEGAWLGAFKSVFCDARSHDAQAFTAFKGRVERILKRSMSRAAGDKRSSRFKLDDSIVECLAALPSTAREEDLEDLFYFMAESFQFSGVPLACDETDVDQVVVDLREALEELHGTKSAPKSQVDPNEHTFLILDQDLQVFPWESLPCMQGRSVSRLPSLSFLRDRLDYAAARAAPGSPAHDVVVNPTRTSFVINPGGDLRNTQSTFEPWLDEQVRDRAWTGVTARAPLEEEVKSALLQKDLFLFFGHGGAEQYIRSQTIRHLPQCAVTMLWGCSSGHLRDQGDFEPVGTPYHYMVAGCPALVANLWDVTDKDIDKFAFSVFHRTGIADAPATDAQTAPVSLTAAVAQSRVVCNLRYLNGAAPVVYGIPVRFDYRAHGPAVTP